MFNPDQAIKSHKEDLLDRKGFAQSLADAISIYEGVDSIVFGLYGEWGYGKTSIINMVVEHIQYINKQKIEKQIIIKFNPWNCSDQNQLISQFFKRLSIALNRKRYNLQDAGKLFETYSKLFEPISYVPTIGWIANIVSKLFKNLGNTLKNKTELNVENLNSIKNALSNLLKNQSHKILIIIDDMDRINDTDIRRTFQLVKSLGDFPNTRYLLSFDKNMIIRALDKVQKDSGVDYLEKIVQIPFEVPSISKEKIEQLLSNQLNELKEKENWDVKYWGNIYHSGLKYLFRNIRDVNRYINCLKFGVGILKGKVSLIDYFAITGIQVFLPDVYYGIRNNPDLFVGIFPQLPHPSPPKGQEKRRCNEIMDKINKLPEEKLLEFLKLLFPRLDSIYGNTYHGGHSLASWRKDGRICSPEHFDTFFRLSISNQKTYLGEIENIISLGNNSTNFSNALLKLNEDGRILTFIRRLQDYTDKDIPPKDIETIITVLMNLGDLFPDGESDIFGGTSFDLSRIFYQLIRRFKDNEIRFNILRNAMNKAKKSLYTIINEVDGMDHQYQKYQTEKIKKPKKEFLINLKQIEELKKLAYDKIEVWSKNGKLAKHRNLSHILYFWRKSGENKKIDSFVGTSIKSNAGLISFISRFLIKGNRHVMGDHVGSIIWRIDMKNLKNFVNIKKIEPRIRKIHSSSKFEHLGDKEKRSIKLVIDAIDKEKESFIVEGDHSAPLILGEKKNPEDIPKLIDFIKSDNANERRLAASALGKMAKLKPHIFESVPSLILLLKDEKPQVRQYAVKALGLIKDERALPHLEIVAKTDEKVYNKKCAEKAIRNLI